MHKNVALYPWYRVTTDIQAWIPVFFFYFSQFVSLEQVIQLSSIYYISVFFLEVPSGYFSDRVGRRITLLISALCHVTAHLFFLAGGGFEFLAAGQVMLAAGIAFQSGTDTALHYDSLAGLGIENEYEAREARAEKYGLYSLSLACMLGGLMASFDLRLAYLLSLCGGLASIFIVLQFSEPKHCIEEMTGSFFHVLLACIRRLRHPVLGWLFAAMIVMYVMEHVPFEFYQPYIRLLALDSLFTTGDSSALISGLVISISMFGGALGATFSLRLRNALGLTGLIGLAALIQLSIVSSIGLILHGAALLMVFIRNFPMAMIHAPVNATIAPLISTGQRATYLSLQGLSQRLFFAILLFTLSQSVGDVNSMDWPVLSSIITSCLLVGIVAMLPLAVIGYRIRNLR